MSWWVGILGGLAKIIQESASKPDPSDKSTQVRHLGDHKYDTKCCICGKHPCIGVFANGLGICSNEHMSDAIDQGLNKQS